jgi:hypothetical protein
MGLRQNAARPSKAGAKARQAATTPVTAALLFHDSDADRAGQLATLLSGAGVTVLPPAALVDAADAVVVFLSAKGLGSPEWVAQATAITQTATRLIPVRVGTIDDEQVPGRLREVNWIDWRPGSVEATFGSVLAGMLSDPDRRDVSRRLLHEAEAWVRSGRSDALLIADYRQARRMAAVLRDLAADRLAAPTDVMRQFVQRSIKVSRPKYQRRRLGVILGVGGTVLALLVASAAIPAIRLGTYDDKESVVIAGDPALLQDLPEWSAANAAALLVHGTPEEQALARTTLLQALNQSWEIDSLQWEVAPESSVPFDHGQLAVVSYDAGLAIINVDTQRAVWATVEPGGPYFLSVDPAGQTAVGLALSGPGAIVINLARHTVRRIAATTEFSDSSQASYGELGNDGVAVVRLPGQHLGELNTVTGAVSELRAYSSVLAVAARTATGTASALVRRADGRVDLVTVPSGRVLASLPGTPAATAGAISPDGRYAIVDGGDGQFWKIGTGQPAAPTGIAAPAVLSGVAWATGNRVILASEDQRGQVYFLPRAEPLGDICTQSDRLFAIVPDPGSAVVSCESQGNATFWRLPPGPLPGRQPGESTASSSTSGPVTVTTSDTQIEIRGPGVDSGMFQPLSTKISVIDVADGGQRVIVGDTLGEVAVIDVEQGYTQEVVAWNDPDHSPIRAVGWDSGPVATTASGQTWRVTDCADCGTDAGLLRAYRARITGCFTQRQLQYMATSTWQSLGLRECTVQAPEPAVLSAG